MSVPDFIEVYEGALDAAACASIVQRFERSGQAVRGRTGGGVNLALKDSWDIEISGKAEWQDVEQALNGAVLRGLAAYLRRYRFALIAPFSLKLPDAKTGELRAIDQASFEALSDAELTQLMLAVFRPGSINLQKYFADQGGYPYWHCEQYPKDKGAETLHRVLLWTIYLNEGFGAGETEFIYQERRIVPATGALLIAPTAFTHTHRGNRPQGRDKYIATSWVLFQRAEALYGGA
jgi:hypothetical protein